MTTEPTVKIETSFGPAAVRWHAVDVPRGLLVLGHGAGGGVDAPDLRAATAAANDVALTVALVLQPYRVAGKKAPPRPPTLDAAWTEVLRDLRERSNGLPVIVGGRSSGARVACRTAATTGALGALCLAFPLQPPGRANSPSRLPELEGAGVPVLVVQGVRDPYGMPPPGPDREIVTVDGDHSLRRDSGALRAAVANWLERIVASSGSPRAAPG